MANQIEQNLDTLQDLLVTTLIERIKSGDANAAELNTARQLLKDNCIQVDSKYAEALPEGELANLSDLMPFVPPQAKEA